MTEESKPTPQATPTLGVPPQKKGFKIKAGAVLTVLAVLILGAGEAVIFLRHSNQIDQTQKDAVDQKDMLNSVNVQISSLNDKLKEMKKQNDALEVAIAGQQGTVDSIRKDYGVFQVKAKSVEGKLSELKEEFNDKFVRSEKEIRDVRTLIEPLKSGINLVKDNTEAWQKDYMATLNDLQNRVAQVSADVEKADQELYKKIEFISMVQEKMIRDLSLDNPSLRGKSPEIPDPTQVMRRETVNNSQPEPQEKIDQPAEDLSK